jgi:hypothetical protein
MSETFHPSTLGEILDRTAQLYRRNFWLFAGVAALPVGVILAMTALATALIFTVPGLRGGYAASPVIPILTVTLLVLLVIPVYITAAIYSYAALTEAAAGTYRGEKLSIRGALKSVTPRFWRYLWLIILQAAVVAIIPAAVAGGAIGLLVFLGTLAGGGAATGVAIGFLVFVLAAAAVVVIIWLILGYSLGISVCVVENKPAWASLQRGWDLSRGTRGRIFVMFLLVIALAFAVSMVAAIPLMIIIFTAAARGAEPGAGSAAVVAAEIIRVVTDFVMQSVLAPISSIALVLFYYDQRIRKEGLDIEWMMQQAGLAPQPALAGPAPPGILGLSQLATTEPSPSGQPEISAPAAPPDTVEEQ